MIYDAYEADEPPENEELVRLSARAPRPRRNERKPPPTPQEMTELNLRRLAGDDSAREEMIVRNMPLAHWYVMKKYGMNTNFDDNIQYAYIGIMEAVDRFDHTRNSGNFAAYAIWWMRNLTTRAYSQELQTVRVPANEWPLILGLRSLVNTLKMQTGKEPSIETLVEKTGYLPERIRRMLRAPLGTVSLDAPLTSEADSGTRHDLIATEDDLDPSERLACQQDLAETCSRIRHLCEHLVEIHTKDKRVNWPIIICKKVGLCGYGSGRTLESVGNDYVLTRERIRQICNKAMKPLSVRKIMPRGMDELEALVSYARTTLDAVYDDPSKIPRKILWLLGDATAAK